MSSTENAEERILELLGSTSKEDLVGLVQSPVYSDALHFIEGELCACSHGLKCGPLRDRANTVVPDSE